MVATTTPSDEFDPTPDEVAPIGSASLDAVPVAPPPAPPIPPSFPPQTVRFYLDLSVYWFALSFIWAGMITIIMQTLVLEMAGPKKDLYLGWTLAVGALVSTVINLVVGTLSDRSRWPMGRRRPYLIAGSVAAVPALLWLAQAGSIGALVLDFCLIQFWLGVATSPSQALVPDMVPKERQGAASAFLGMGGLIGTLAGLVLCQKLVAAGTLHGHLTQSASLLRIVTTLSVLLVLSMLYTVWRIPEQPARGAAQARLGLIETMRQSFRVNPREYPDFFWLIASRFVINMGFYSGTEFMLYYVRDSLRAPEPGKTVGIIFMVITFAGLLGNFPAGILSDRMSKKRVVYISAGITGLAALIFLLTSSIAVALVAAFVFGVGYGAFQAVDWALATNLLPEHDEAKFMGVWHVAFTVPQVIAPLVGGTIAYFFNTYVGPGFGYRVVLFLVLGYLVAGAALIRPVRERVFPRLEAAPATPDALPEMVPPPP